MSRHTSRTNLRGLPHAPTSQVQVVLPAPLAAALPRPLSMRRDTETDRLSSADKWISVGRDDSAMPFSTMPSPLRASRRASASAIMTSSPSSTYFQHPFPPPPVPRIPKEMITPA
ncbi:hypothetical protein C0993_004932 [Termitomyces sp. T159_Od127]|nr:hypothetical protein C0993_004932 [Termitomyces sp. T159_Od127]